MWAGDIERSPVLAAPSFANCISLSTITTSDEVGEEDDDPQAANDLCERYLPLAYKIASNYRDRGVPHGELRSAAEIGLVLASRKFDSNKGAFGPYAKLWITGELTRLFKPTRDALKS